MVRRKPYPVQFISRQKQDVTRLRPGIHRIHQQDGLRMKGADRSGKILRHLLTDQNVEIFAVDQLLRKRRTNAVIATPGMAYAKKYGDVSRNKIMHSFLQSHGAHHGNDLSAFRQLFNLSPREHRTIHADIFVADSAMTAFADTTLHVALQGGNDPVLRKSHGQ